MTRLLQNKRTDKSLAFDISKLVDLVLKEDIGNGDITTDNFIKQDLGVTAEIIFKESGIVSGIYFIEKLINYFDKELVIDAIFKDGSFVKKGQVVLKITGNARSILKIERTMLNFLQRLCGIATLAHKFHNLVKDLNVKILDTRKTTPAMRFLEKQAVLDGGCSNHRIGLYDMVLLKENHLFLIDDLQKLILQFSKKNKAKIEVEVDSIKKLKQVLQMPIDIIMLDNFSLKKTKYALAIIRKTKKDVLVESSGNITLKNVKNYAKTGVDRISVGSITHSAKALDISLKITT